MSGMRPPATLCEWVAGEDAVDALLLGDSAVMRRVREQVRRVAPIDLPVLIQGPTGAGKELVAQALHAASGRPGRFVPFNICAIPESLFEATLFGHVRGAYTGATRDAPGHLQEADAGTAFADEISGLALALQPKLLRAVETRVYRPVGDRVDRCSDFRWVSASNEPLGALIASHRVRRDLAERLSTFMIEVPPLAARREDIPLLVRHFLAHSSVNHARGRLEMNSAALGVLGAYEWPHNVRELRNVVERVCAFADTAIITAEDIVAAIGTTSATPSRVPVETRAEAKRRELLAALVEAQWDTTVVAERLSVHRATVYRRMDRLGIARYDAR